MSPIELFPTAPWSCQLDRPASRTRPTSNPMPQAIWLLTTGAREAAFRNIKTIAECLADELTNAAKGSSNRCACCAEMGCVAWWQPRASEGWGGGGCLLAPVLKKGWGCRGRGSAGSAGPCGKPVSSGVSPSSPPSHARAVQLRHQEEGRAGARGQGQPLSSASWQECPRGSDGRCCGAAQTCGWGAEAEVAAGAGDGPEGHAIQQAGAWAAAGHTSAVW